jgi:hypothetical protein
MKKSFGYLLCVVLCFTAALAARAEEPLSKKERQYYELRVYHLASNEQVASVERYLQNAMLPALHRAGIKTVGVFKWLGNDTAAVKKLFVLIPHPSLEQVEKTREKLQKDKALEAAGGEYLNVAYNQPAYLRFETVLLHAFEDMPRLSTPQLSSSRAERVYELRSYESASEKIGKNKVQMFNEGGEIGLFKRLGFNAVFYGEVVAGSRMPNLMYLTTFENKAARDEHWKTFGSDPEWKRLSGLPEYKNNVSKIDIFFLAPTTYSDL